jgi:hypothetical protein
MKRCGCCRQTKDRTEFHTCRQAWDGKQSYCKPCLCAVTKEWREKRKLAKIAAFYAAAEVSAERRAYEAEVWLSLFV